MMVRTFVQEVSLNKWHELLKSQSIATSLHLRKQALLRNAGDQYSHERKMICPSKAITIKAQVDVAT